MNAGLDDMKSKLVAQRDLKKYDIVLIEKCVFAPYSTGIKGLLKVCKSQNITEQVLRDEWFMNLETLLSQKEQDKYHPQDLGLVSILKLYAQMLHLPFEDHKKGIGLLRLIGKLNHSCDPNCVIIYNEIGCSMHLIENRSINTGDELTIAYRTFMEYQDFQSRQMILSKIGFNGCLGFMCVCDRCLKESQQSRPPIIHVNIDKDMPASYKLYVNCMMSEPCSDMLITIIRVCFDDKHKWLSKYDPMRQRFELKVLTDKLMCLLITSQNLSLTVRKSCLTLLEDVHMNMKLLEPNDFDIYHEILLFYATLVCLNFENGCSDILQKTKNKNLILIWVRKFYATRMNFCLFFAMCNLDSSIRTILKKALHFLKK